MEEQQQQQPAQPAQPTTLQVIDLADEEIEMIADQARDKLRLELVHQREMARLQRKVQERKKTP